MKIGGSYSLDAPREAVWSALNDVEVLARTIPGCQRLDEVGEHTYETTLKIGLQAVKGVYTGTVTLSDIQPPQSYTISVDGKGSNGFLRGSGGIELQEDGPEKTKLVYSGDAAIGGTLATVGQRLIEGASRTLINQALKAFAAQVQARIDAAKPAAEQEVPTAAAEAPAAEAAASATEAPAPAAQPAAAEAPAPTGTAVAEAPVQAAPATATSTAPTASSNGLVPAASAPVRKSVVVPEHEQLKPESLVLGVAQDFVKERPWLPWVLLAFVLGWLAGRRS